MRGRFTLLLSYVAISLCAPAVINLRIAVVFAIAYSRDSPDQLRYLEVQTDPTSC